jgi:hypothetical protein
MIRPRSTDLFQGDSITDAGRDRDEPGPNLARALGWGAVTMLPPNCYVLERAMVCDSTIGESVATGSSICTAGGRLMPSISSRM